MKVSWLKKTVSCVTIAAFLMASAGPSFSQMTQASVLPAPGQMVPLSASSAPAVLKGIKIYPENPFRFDFILDPGDAPLEGDGKNESAKLVRYFLASLTMPEKDLWVNLSPYEKDRIIAHEFGQTEMGRELLSQDYLLKQITASLIYPEGDVGKKFWARVYQMAYDEYGTTDIPIDTFNKVWITPDKAVVYENGDKAFIVKSHMKVMLESDYVAMENNALPTGGHVAPQGYVSPSPSPSEQPLNAEATQGVNRMPSEFAKTVLREIAIPELEREVNEGKHFAPLRQVYQSLILAAWFKKKIKESVLSQVYVDRKKIAGVNIDDPEMSQKIWAQYVEAFKKGAYNYIKEEQDAYTGELIPRKYFSGGVTFDLGASASLEIQTVSDDAMLAVINENLLRKALRIIRSFFRSSVPVGSALKSEKAPAPKLQPPEVLFEEIPVPQGTVYSSLIPFLQAQKRLKSLSRAELATLMSFLGILNKGEILGSDDFNEYYDRIYAHLAQTGYSKEVVSKIKGDVEPDVGLDRTIFFQSGSSKVQSIIEAVANSIDALGGSIGQFGMGVKQILAWLEEGERLEVFSKKNGQSACRLVMTRINGSFQVAVFQSTEEDFRKAMGGVVSPQGTVINVIKNKDISTDGEGGTLNNLEKKIHDRFAYVKWLHLWTRVKDAGLKYANGWEHREVLAGLANLTHENMQKTRGQGEGTIIVSLESRVLRMIDTGGGMDFQILSRMFLPVDGGDKENKVVSTPEEIDAEVKNISLVHEREGDGSSVVFARNGEVIMRVSLGNVITNSILQGQLMVDLGRLIRVSPARDKVILQRNYDEEPLKKGFSSFVRLILQGDRLDEEKIRIINTLIAGLEGLGPRDKEVKEKDAVSDIIDGVKRVIKKEMKDFVAALRQKGSIILPLQGGFDNFQMPQARPALFLNESLFDWRGSEIRQLKEHLGAATLPIVLEGKNKDTGLRSRSVIMSVPFKLEVWRQYHFENFEDILRVVKSRQLPVVRGDGYVIVPSQIGDLLKGLSASDAMTQLLLELMKTFAEEDTATGYELVDAESGAFAAFSGKESTSDQEEAVRNTWPAEENFLRWGSKESSPITPRPYGLEESEGDPYRWKYSDGVDPRIGYHLNKTVISARGQMVSRDAVSKPFDVLRIREAVGLGSRDIGIYLDALGEKAAQDLRSIAKEKNRIDFSNQENTDWAMFTLSPDHIRFEEISEFTMNDFLKESRGIFEDEECVLMSRPHKEKTAYYYFRKADQGAGARFFYFDLPFEVDEVVVQDGMVVLRKENILFQFSFLKRSPVADFFFTLNVAPALADQWQGKLTAAYDQLLGFISKEAYGMNVDQLKLSFDIFYSLVRQRMGEVIEGKASVEDQKVAIDVLIDDVAHTLFNINKGLDDVWSDFIDENIIPLKPEEREDFYQRFFRKLLQASALGG